jgi:hypothetical protein
LSWARPVCAHIKGVCAMDVMRMECEKRNPKPGSCQTLHCTPIALRSFNVPGAVRSRTPDEASVASQTGGGGTVLVSGDFFGREHCDGGDVSSVIYRFNVMSIRVLGSLVHYCPRSTTGRRSRQPYRPRTRNSVRAERDCQHVRPTTSTASAVD